MTALLCETRAHLDFPGREVLGALALKRASTDGMITITKRDTEPTYMTSRVSLRWSLVFALHLPSFAPDDFNIPCSWSFVGDEVQLK